QTAPFAPLADGRLTSIPSTGFELSVGSSAYFYLLTTTATDSACPQPPAGDLTIHFPGDPSAGAVVTGFSLPVCSSDTGVFVSPVTTLPPSGPSSAAPSVVASP